MNRIVLANLVYLVAIFMTSTQAPAITAEELADICEAMEKNIQDIHMEFEWTYDPLLDPNDLSGNNFLMTKGAEKLTCATKRPFGQFSLSTEELTLANRHEASHSETIKQSYNGKVAKRLQKTNWQHGNDYLEGLVTRRDSMVLNMRHTPAVFSVLRFSLSEVGGRKSLAELLRGDTAILDKIVKINGFNAIRVDILTGKTKRPWGSVYFSVDHGYAPVRYDDWNGDDLIARYDVTSLEKISDGLWFPKSGYREGPGRERRSVFMASKIRLNQGLGDDFFDFEFPAGTRIYDEILGLVYTFRPSEDEFLAWLGDQEPLIVHGVQEVENTLVETNHKARQEAVNDKVIPSASDARQESVNSQQQANIQRPRITLLIYGSIVLGAAILTFLAVRRYHSHRGACS